MIIGGRKVRSIIFIQNHSMTQVEMELVTWKVRSNLSYYYHKSLKKYYIFIILGITAKVDYFYKLGINAIWISPFFKSPMVDNGYDISDYKEVDPLFGTVEDFTVKTQI